MEDGNNRRRFVLRSAFAAQPCCDVLSTPTCCCQRPLARVTRASGRTAGAAASESLEKLYALRTGGQSVL